MLVYWIWLAHRTGVSDRMKAALLAYFRDPEAVYFADEAALEQIPELTAEARASLRDRDLGPSEKILEVCYQKHLGILTFQDAAYPSRLKNISDPPIVLYYKGQLPAFDSIPMIGVVGTRKASAYGLTVAKRMGYQIGKCGGAVVSGLAYGIDGVAMSGALTAGAMTVGVLGCGPDIVYPLSNRSLFRDVERYGCILSEFAPGQPAAKWTFPKRNRIISGLSCGVVVVEAPEKSGALLTARMALDQGRDVFVIPGNVDMPGFVGSNRLLRDGAIAVSTGEDVLMEYEGLYPGKLPRTRGPKAEIPKSQPPKTDRAEEKAPVPQKSDDKTIDKALSGPYSDLKETAGSLSPEEQQVYSAIGEECLVDQVIASAGLGAGKVLSILTMLELKGKICRLPGKRVARKR